MSTYFQDKAHRLSLSPAGDLPLRKAQRGALLAIGSHFTLKDTPAIVTLPTGVGKTLVGSAVPYLLAQPGRVLVVVPSRVLRTQTVVEARSQDQLIRYGVLSGDGPPPAVLDLDHRLGDWAEAEDYDLVVATPSCASPTVLKNAGKPIPGSGFFSTVIVDEAHHVPAATWKALVDYFAGAAHVFLTATPFRNDRREVPGELVYAYPLRRAVEDGAYAPVEMIGVPSAGQTRDQLDIRIRDTALERLDDPKHVNSAILIRADGISRVNELARLYRDAGAEIEVVHSDLTPATVERRLERVRSREVKGVAFVGALGEGFDCPNLKIGAYHDKHKSLPVTLQFIGRLTRRASDVAETAEVVTSFDDLKADTWELYRHTAVWEHLIPQLADKAVEAVAERKALLDAMPEFDDPEVSRLHLHPRRKAVVYEHRHDGTWSPVLDDQFLADNHLHAGDRFAMGQIIYSAALPNQELLLLLTRHRIHPLWMASTALDSVGYELHTVALEPDPPTDTRFVYVTSNTRHNEHVLASLVIGTDDTRLADTEMIERYARNVDLRQMHNVGMRATSSRGRGRRAYTTAAGSDVVQSLLDSDRRGNQLGHAMGTAEKLHGGRRGATTVSFSNSRINETPTGDLAEYLQWVREISRIMRAAQQLATQRELIPGLAIERTALAWPQDQRLLFVDPNWEDAEHYEVVHHGDIRLLELLAQLDADDPSQLMRVEGWIEGRLCISGRMRPNGRWESTNPDPLVYGPREISLSEYLEEFPPRFYFADGTSIAGGRVANHAEERITLPPGLLHGLSWRNVDITKETKPAPGLLSIHAYVGRFLLRIYPKAWIIFDDARGELADHVVISPTAEDLSQVTLVFVHSKYSSSPDPGQRVEDLDELTGQVMRSRRWIQEGRFLWGDIARRLRNRAATRVLTHGDRSKSALLAQCDVWSTSPPSIRAEIVAVQPGFTVTGFQTSFERQTPGQTAHGIAECLHAASSWLIGGSIGFHMIGHR